MCIEPLRPILALPLVKWSFPSATPGLVFGNPTCNVSPSVNCAPCCIIGDPSCKVVRLWPGCEIPSPPCKVVVSVCYFCLIFGGPDCKVSLSVTILLCPAGDPTCKLVFSIG